MQAPIPHHPIKFCTWSQGEGITSKEKKKSPGPFAWEFMDGRRRGWAKEARVFLCSISPFWAECKPQGETRNSNKPELISLNSNGWCSGTKQNSLWPFQVPFNSCRDIWLRARGPTTSPSQNDIVTFSGPQRTPQGFRHITSILMIWAYWDGHKDLTKGRERLHPQWCQSKIWAWHPQKAREPTSSWNPGSADRQVLIKWESEYLLRDSFAPSQRIPFLNQNANFILLQQQTGRGLAGSLAALADVKTLKCPSL